MEAPAASGPRSSGTADRLSGLSVSGEAAANDITRGTAVGTAAASRHVPAPASATLLHSFAALIPLFRRSAGAVPFASSSSLALCRLRRSSHPLSTPRTADPLHIGTQIKALPLNHRHPHHGGAVQARYLALGSRCGRRYRSRLGQRACLSARHVSCHLVMPLSCPRISRLTNLSPQRQDSPTSASPEQGYDKVAGAGRCAAL